MTDSSPGTQTSTGNYETKLPVLAGLIAGLAGSIAIIVVIRYPATGRDIRTAAPDRHLVYGRIWHWCWPITSGSFCICDGAGAAQRVVPPQRLHHHGLIWHPDLVRVILRFPIVALMVAADVNVGVLIATNTVLRRIVAATYDRWRIPKPLPPRRPKLAIRFGNKLSSVRGCD
jgi:hypothetical protein